MDYVPLWLPMDDVYEYGTASFNRNADMILFYLALTISLSLSLSLYIYIYIYIYIVLAMQKTGNVLNPCVAKHFIVKNAV